MKWIPIYLYTICLLASCNNDFKAWKTGYEFGVSDTFISRGKVGQKVYNTMQDEVFEIIDTFKNGLLKVGRVKLSLNVSKSRSVSIRRGDFKWFGAINIDRQFVIPCLFDEVRYLSDSLFAVRYSIYESQHQYRNLWAVIDTNSQFKTDFVYQSIWANKEKDVIGINLEGKTIIINE